MKRNLPDSSLFLNRTIPDRPDLRITQVIGSGLNAHVFLVHSSSLSRNFACKVIPFSNLIGAEQEPPLWRNEFTKANSAPSSRVVKYVHEGKWDIDGRSYVYWIADFVEGQTLRAVIRAKTATMGFVESFLENMLDFLRELQEVKLQHGDFHDGNVLVESKPKSLTEKVVFRVTDFGVAPLTSGATLLDDFEQLSTMARNLLESIDYSKLSYEDRFLYDWVNDQLLSKKLFEHDSANDSTARNPAALYEILKAAHKAFVAQTAGASRKNLITPFDYLSCEQIGESHALLKELYSDKLLGLPAIEEANNLVLTGPRGCGKTTVFRSLSLKHRHHTKDDSPGSLPYLGVYYRCDDLYFSFPRYSSPAKVEAINIPLHFVTATLIRELLESLGLWLARHFESDWKKNEAPATAELWQMLSIEPPNHPNANTFTSLIRALNQERERAAKKQRFVKAHDAFGLYFGPETVPQACAVLAKYFAPIQERHIFFFIDDYSSPKITIELQQNLNRLLMQRSSDCFFKLATESPASYASSDIDGKAYVEGREFRLRNLGMDFIHASKADKLRFVDDVFGRRFRYATGYPVSTLQDLIGENEAAPAHNEVARSIRNRERVEIWGRSALGELCSGDVHFFDRPSWQNGCCGRWS